MAYRLGKKEIQKRMTESYTEEFKIIKRLGEDKGKKLIEKISFERMSLTNNDMKEMIEFRFSKERDEEGATPYYVIKAFNEGGDIVGQLSYRLDNIVDLMLLNVDLEVENRHTIAVEMLKQLEQISKLCGAGSINGRYYPCFKGEFKFDELFKGEGFVLEQGAGRWNELWKRFPEHKNEDEEEIDL